MEDEDRKIEIASRLGHLMHDNYPDRLAETARLLEGLTGKDWDSKGIQEIADKINGRLTLWQKIKNYLTPHSHV